MDALIYEAETAAKLLTDLTEGPIDSNYDTLEVNWLSANIIKCNEFNLFFSLTSRFCTRIAVIFMLVSSRKYGH